MKSFSSIGLSDNPMDFKDFGRIFVSSNDLETRL